MSRIVLCKQQLYATTSELLNITWQLETSLKYIIVYTNSVIEPINIGNTYVAALIWIICLFERFKYSLNICIFVVINPFLSCHVLCFYIYLLKRNSITARPAKAYFCVCSGYWRQIYYTITKILLSTKVVSPMTEA